MLERCFDFARDVAHKKLCTTNSRWCEANYVTFVKVEANLTPQQLKQVEFQRMQLLKSTTSSRMCLDPEKNHTSFDQKSGTCPEYNIAKTSYTNMLPKVAMKSN